MATLNNPFVVYGYKGAEYFCDRQKETEKMISTLHNERNITLVAPRRMGKTGLIHHVFHQMEEQYEGVKCFYLDIFATKNLEQMVQLMASEIIGKLDLKPSEGRESLKRIFEYLKQSGKRCYIAIDEFQQILSYPENGVEAMIRSYIQFLPNVYFVFSGSQQHMMQEMFLSANRPFFQSSLVLSLPCIEEPVYRKFANRLLSSQHRVIDESVFSYIYQQSGSVTWYVQAILHGIYEHGSYGITKSLVDEVIQELIEEQAMAYQNYCAWLTENQQMLLLAIASESLVSSPLSQQFISTHHLPATSSVKTALKALVDKQLVSKTPNGYLVSDRFFAKWLVRGGITL
ncbi:MAG: AAA family ATPase [Prevotella sp.]|nr:AAA family ATPase [Prevotella sp.]